MNKSRSFQFKPQVLTALLIACAFFAPTSFGFINVLLMKKKSAPSPTVTAVSPIMKLGTGGGTLTVTGTNFRSGLTISIGGTACTSPSYVSATSATCTIPASAGTISQNDVTVTNSDGTNGTLTGGFYYLGEPRIWVRGDAGIQQVAPPKVDWWFDQSGNANDFRQFVSGSTNPSYVASSMAFNGMPVLSFNGAAFQALETYDVGALRNTAGASVFMAASVSQMTDARLFSFERNSAGSPRVFLTADNSPVGTNIGANATGNFSFYGRHQDADATHYLRGGTVSTGTAFQMGLVINYPSRAVSLYVNRTLLDSSTTFGAVSSATKNSANTDSVSSLIGGQDGIGYMTGNIAEILVYRLELSAAQRQAVENYLKVRYSLP